MADRKIIWEAWEDPLGTNADDFGSDGLITDEEKSEYEMLEAEFGKFSPPKQMVNTPFGIMVLHDQASISSDFEIWVMHTNFDIDEDVTDIIDGIPGVEAILPQTRYRMRVFFPKTEFFNTPETKMLIERAICDEDMFGFDGDDDNNMERNHRLLTKMFSSQVADSVSEIVSSISADQWAILILPNGEMELVMDTDEDFSKRLDTITTAKQMVGGFLITSGDM
jgi:hypothetical protein